MRAAQLNEANEVVNYAEVAGFGPIGGIQFVDPKESKEGDIWNPDTGEFTLPPQPEE